MYLLCERGGLGFCLYSELARGYFCSPALAQISHPVFPDYLPCSLFQVQCGSRSCPAEKFLIDPRKSPFWNTVTRFSLCPNLCLFMQDNRKKAFADKTVEQLEAKFADRHKYLLKCLMNKKLKIGDKSGIQYVVNMLNFNHFYY